MRKCAACGQQTPRDLCHFCMRTKALIVTRRCVSCTAQIEELGVNIQGKCADCLSRNERLSAGTRWLLVQAAAARYYDRPFRLVEHRAAAA